MIGIPGRRGVSAARRGSLAVVALTLFFLLRGFFLALALPFGDPLDELFHYGYAEYLAETGRPPRASEPSMPAEVLEPLQWLPRSSTLPGPHITWKEFAAMDEGERAVRRGRAFPQDPKRSLFLTANYESQQPPLAYAPAALLLRALRNLPLDRRLLALRLAAALAAACAVPIAHLFFRRILPRPTALAATAAFVAFPGVGSLVGRFTNDALALPIAAGLLVCLADIARGRLRGARPGLLAALLALGCWTKLYFLLLVPAPPLAALCAPSRRRGAVLLRASAAVAVALLLLGPWILRQHADTGDWLGLSASKQAAHWGITVADRIQTFPTLFSLRFWIVFGRTFLWPGTWSAMGAPAAASVLLALVLAALLLIPLLRPSGRSATRSRGSRGASLALALFVTGQVLYASSYAAVARARGHAPSAGPDGWYLLILLPALLAAGCAAGRSVPRRLLLAALLVFAVCEWAFTMGVLPAVYAGWSEPNGSNAPLALWASMLRSPFVALRTFSQVGLARAPSPLLGALLSVAFALLLAGAFAARRPASHGHAR